MLKEEISGDDFGIGAQSSGRQKKIMHATNLIDHFIDNNGP